jgi:hypothetical protein
VDPSTLRPETPDERREREALEAELEKSPLRGKPIEPRLRNFRPDTAAAVRALEGPPAWMRRLRDIEEGTAAHVERLAEAWRELAAEVEDPAEFAARWRRVAATWDFREVNGHIARHNRNFPVESRLPMDPRTRDFVRVNGRRYERQPLDAEWILGRFPPDRATATDAT